mmetsp:Transcript_1846/g.3495  ORF Transcript_1846/g.3495 Transcript_1846/m.3495 type:complete len:364 (-) Transcript_1846:124-1215(-)
MGACGTKECVIYNESPNLKAYQSQFLAMGITQSKLTIFHQHFKTIDKKNKNAITIRQMLQYFGFDKNEFIRKAFSVLLLNKAKDTLSFRDFVLTIWNFCTLGDDFGLFVFAVYDFDGNKELDHEEAVELMTDLYGGAKTGPDFDELTARILKQKKMGACGVQEHYFKQYCVLHPGFLRPATKMQTVLKKKVIGEKWWNGKALEQREEFCDFEFETISSISARLKKDEYDKDLEVNNLSETSSEAAERAKYEEKMRKYREYKGISASTDEEVFDNEDSSDEEAKDEPKKRAKSSKKHIPVAMTSTKRRASVSSGASTGSMGSISERSARNSAQPLIPIGILKNKDGSSRTSGGRRASTSRALKM